MRPRYSALSSGALLGGEDQQQAAIVVVGREEIGDRLGGQITLGVDGYPLAQRADAPLEGRLDRGCFAGVVRVGGGAPISPVDPLETEHVTDRSADHLLVLEAGELERTFAQIQDTGLLVEREERGARRRHVVVEQLEEEGEAALRATLRAGGEPGGALPAQFSVPAVGADEVRHSCGKASRSESSANRRFMPRKGSPSPRVRAARDARRPVRSARVRAGCA